MMDCVGPKQLRLTIAALFALAMIWLGFAHRPVVFNPSSLPAISVDAFALPDGSLPDLCLPDADGPGKPGHFATCEACLVSGGHGAIAISAAMARPATIVLATLAISSLPSLKAATRQRAKSRGPPIA